MNTSASWWTICLGWRSVHTKRKTYQFLQTERFPFKNVIALNLFMFMLKHIWFGTAAWKVWPSRGFICCTFCIFVQQPHAAAVGGDGITSEINVDKVFISEDIYQIDNVVDIWQFICRMHSSRTAIAGSRSRWNHALLYFALLGAFINYKNAKRGQEQIDINVAHWNEYKKC